MSCNEFTKVCLLCVNIVLVHGWLPTADGLRLVKGCKAPPTSHARLAPLSVSCQEASSAAAFAAWKSADSEPCRSYSIAPRVSIWQRSTNTQIGKGAKKKNGFQPCTSSDKLSAKSLFDPTVKLCAIQMCKCWGMPCFTLPLCLIFGFRSGCLLFFGTCIAEASAQQYLAFNIISLPNLLQLVLLVVSSFFFAKKKYFYVFFMSFLHLVTKCLPIGYMLMFFAGTQSHVFLRFQYCSSYF